MSKMLILKDNEITELMEAIDAYFGVDVIYLKDEPTLVELWVKLRQMQLEIEERKTTNGYPF